MRDVACNLLVCAAVVVSVAPAKDTAEAFVLRGTLREQYLEKGERRYEAPFELSASGGGFRIRAWQAATTPQQALDYASDYQSSYLSRLFVEEGVPKENIAIATMRYGPQLDKLHGHLACVVWAWLASRLPASGEYDRRFLALSPPALTTERPGRLGATVRPEIVRDRAGRVTGVRLWACLADTPPVQLAPSATTYLAAELKLACDAAGRPREAALTVFAVRLRKNEAGPLRTEPVRRISYHGEVASLDDRAGLERHLTHLASRDPPFVAVHDYRFPDESTLGYRSYRIRAGEPIPFDPLRVPAGR